MVGTVQVGELCEDGAWVFGQRVEEGIINQCVDNLSIDCKYTAQGYLGIEIVHRIPYKR